MLEPADLLHVARTSLNEMPGSDSNAVFHRAISTAYYAVFHHLSRAAADCFVCRDARGRPAYNLIYRGLSHTRLRDICKQLSAAKLGSALQAQLGRASASKEACTFASAVPELQDLRIDADYNPSKRFTQSDAEGAVLLAELTMLVWTSISEEDQADILALMLAAQRR